MRQIPFVLLLVAVLLAGAAPVASAAEDPVALLAQLETLRKAEDASGLAKAVAQVPDVYKAIDNPTVRGKLRGELGKVLKDKDLGEARTAAIAALVALEDAKSAWKTLSRHMPDRKAKEATAFDLAVVKAAGKLAAARAIKPLTELAYKAKAHDLAGAAVEAMGGYGADEKNRVKILDELIDIGKRTRPGQSTEKATSDEAQKRWAVVGGVLVTALNNLTGQNLTTFEDWESLQREYKSRPKDMFVE